MINSRNREKAETATQMKITYRAVSHKGYKKIFKSFVVACSLASLSFINLPSFSETVFLKGTAYQTGISIKDVLVGSSEVVVSNAPIKRVAVTDPSVADIRILSDTSAMVRGKKIGQTTLLIWEGKDSSVRPTRFDIKVKRDIRDLIASLKLIDPNIDVDYVIVPASRIEQAVPINSNGAYTTSYKTSPETVGDPAPSVVVSNQPPQNAAPPAGGGNSAGNVVERIILSGKVKSADVVGRALSTAATYMGEDPNFRIVTRNGGMIVDQVSELLSGADSSGGGFAGSQSLTNPLKFTSNLRGNLGGGSIVANATGSIMSFLEVRERPQISIMIRFYEVSRSINKELGTSFLFSPGGGPNKRNGIYGISAPNNLASATGNQAITAGDSLAQAAASVATAVGGSAAGTFFSLFPKQNLAIAVQALESKGELKILAEPNLVVASGEPGKFLAGGEIPIRQAVSTLGAIGQQVTFETFGISLNVLPSITDGDSILMNVTAQTRDIDSTNPFAGGGVPAFRTRRADTQVEMDPSQALIIGGLINANSVNNLKKIPVLGDIPILGALARSKSFARSDSELIIVLAPEIVRGGNPGQILKPLAIDNASRPGEYDYIPRSFDASRTSVPIGQPQGVTVRAPVDLSKPTTVNDLDHIYH
jgi:Flp pilus assembly secretin CpaC